MRTRWAVVVAVVSGCSASHGGAPAPGDPGGDPMTPETQRCEGGLFLFEQQLHLPPSFGATATGDVWFADGSTLKLASSDFSEVQVLTEDDPYGPSLSIEEDRIAFRRGGDLVVHDLASGAEASVPAPFPHRFGFFETESGPSRAWSCADTTLSVFVDGSPVTVDDSVENCHGVESRGAVLFWRDVTRRFAWLRSDSLEPMHVFLGHGVMRVTGDGRWLVHHPASACTAGGDDCPPEPLEIVDVLDATDGSWVDSIAIGEAGSFVGVVDGPESAAIHASSRRVAVIVPDGIVRTFDGYQPLSGLVGGGVLARADDGGIHVLELDGSETTVVAGPMELDARVSVSESGTHFAVAHPTGECLDGGEHGCRDEEWRLSIFGIDSGRSSEWIGHGRPGLGTITDGGLLLVSGFAELDEPPVEGYRYRVLDHLGRELWDEDGLLSVAIEDRGGLVYAVYERGLRIALATGSVSTSSAMADDLEVDRFGDRVLRLVGFPEPEEDPSDLGPPTRYCLFTTPLPRPGS